MENHLISTCAFGLWSGYDVGEDKWVLVAVFQCENTFEL